MRKLLLFLLFSITGYSQTGTPTLIGHVASDSSGNTTPAANTTGSNFGLICGKAGETASDSGANSWQSIYAQGGYGGSVAFYASFGMTGASNQTFSLTGGLPFVVMTFNHVASGPDQTAFVTAPNQNPQTTVVTPTHGSELIAACLQGVYGSTPVVSVNAPYTLLDTAPPYLGLQSIGYSDAYTVQGTTASSSTMNVYMNQANGENTGTITLYSDLSPSTLSTTTTSLPSIMRTTAYPRTCINAAGGAAPYTITSTGSALPAGLSFDGKCITGTPTTTGTTTGIVYHIVDHLGTAINTPSLSLQVTPFVTIMDLQGPNYGFVVFPGAKRHPGVLEANAGATGRVNWTVSDSTKGTLSCTTNCAGTVTVTAIGTAGTCAVSGTVGHYSITGGNDFTVTSTSRDQNEDGTYSSTSETYHICKGDHLVDVQPAYNQAFFGQEKITFGYVKGQIGQALTWTCTAPDSSSCNSALDINLPTGTGPGTQRHNRDVTFTAPSVVGSYKLTACSVSDYDGTQACNYEWIYVGGPLTTAHTGTAALPISPEGTEVQACFPDPRFGARSWTVKADGTGDYTHLWGPIIDDGAGGNDINGGFLVRVFNTDTTGTNPTQYPDFFYISDGGTRDLPSVVCGVPDASGHLPIQQRQGITGSGRNEGYYGTVWQGNMITVAPRNGGSAGFDTGLGPDFINIWGIFQKDSGHASDSIAVEVAPGSRHLAMEGMHTDYTAQGAILNNNTYLGGRHYSEFNSAIGGHYENCGDFSQGAHCLYMESMYPLIANNLFSGQRPGGGGLANKIRGGGSIVVSNSYLGSYGYPVIAWPAMTDTGGYTSVENNLGVPGDTNCSESAYCSVMSASGDENWLHMAANEQALAEAYVYGNIFSQASGAMYGILEYGAQNINQCNAPGPPPLPGTDAPQCTNGIDHTGGLYIWNNTFDREGGAIGISSNVIYNNNKAYAAPVRTYPWLYYQNNSMFNAGVEPDGGTPPPFQIDMAPYFQGGLQTNLIATGSLDLSTPVIPGHTGWSANLGGNGDPIQPWTAYSPKDSYLSGINTFVTTSTLPYDTTTFKPTSGSPLIAAGTPIVDPLTSILPLRYEPDPVNGFALKRRDSSSTIGARSAAVSSALTVNTNSLAGGTVASSYSYALTASGGSSPYTWALTSGTLPAGLTLSSSGILSGTPTSAGTVSGLVFTVTDSTSATASSGSLSITIAAASGGGSLTVTTTSPLTPGQVGVAYTFTLAATSGTAPYHWALSSGTLPAGITLNGTTGILSGTPTTAGTSTGLVFTATDSASTPASAASTPLSLVIAAPVAPPSATGSSITGNATLTGGVVIQ